MTNMKRPMKLEDLWAIKVVIEVQVSPDGTTAAYVVQRQDEKQNRTTSAIHLVNLKTGEDRQFTNGETIDNTPRYSPDGKRIAFVSRRHEDKPQIYIVPVAGGEARRLTSSKDGAHTPVWSPDSSRLCFSSDVETGSQTVGREKDWFEAHQDTDGDVPRMRRQTAMFARFDGRGYLDKRPHLFVVEVDAPEAEPRQLTDGDQDDLGPAWSPDGRSIVFLSSRREDAEHKRTNDLWLLDVETGRQHALTNGGFMAQLPAWSPDGRSIAFYAREDETPSGYQDTQVWTVEAAGGEPRNVSGSFGKSAIGIMLSDTGSPVDLPPSWSPDGNDIYFVAIDRGDRAVFAISPDGKNGRRVTADHGMIGSAQVTSDGSTMVCAGSNPTRPFEVCSAPASGGSLRWVTNVNASFLREVEIAPTENLHYRGYEDWEIEGWLVTPPARTPQHYPMVLHVHGGPQCAYGNAFSLLAQSLAGAGYASLLLNPRGSIGYGEEFAIAADWGEDDFRDLMAGVDAVLARGDVDAEKLGVTGASYGGFMTNWTIGHTDRFAAAVAVNSISNFVSFYGVSDIGSTWFERTFKDSFGGRFWESRGRWEKYILRSPITYVEDIDTPLLLISGEEDYRTPIEQAEQIHTALRMRAKTVELIRLPKASHGIPMSPHQRYIRWQLTEDWFDTYLKGERPAELPKETSAPATEPVPMSKE